MQYEPIWKAGKPFPILMTKTHFDFKQFSIYHDRCAMKVGTDGVLLGAWADAGPHVREILDVGTGSGLVAIMLAQRCEADITGIDIDAEAVGQASENGLSTPWKNRLHFERADALSYEPRKPFDLIVSNPPFFANDLQCPEKRRNNARHSQSLPLDILAGRAAEWLREGGEFCVILPSDMADPFVMQGWERGLNLCKRCYVHTVAGTSPKRALLCLKKGDAPYPESTRLYVRGQDGAYTEEYRRLTEAYYLHL